MPNEKANATKIKGILCILELLSGIGGGFFLSQICLRLEFEEIFPERHLHHVVMFTIDSIFLNT